jgi:hypothetical protein
VPTEFEDAERDSIKAAYEVAADWYAQDHPLDFATFVISWLACLGVHSATLLPPT